MTWKSNLADYPRILVGKTLYNFLQMNSEFNNDEPSQKVRGHLAIDARKMIYEDSDGLLALDYLGKPIELLERDFVQKIIKQAHAFISNRYIEYLEEDNFKLAAKYGRLKSYYDSRLVQWDVDVA